MSDAQEWLSITDAAARLSAAGDVVDRSTLSRYVQQHAEAIPQRREGRSNLVDFEALAGHRVENVRLRSVPAIALPKLAGGRSARFAGSQSDGVARKAQADAEMREMDLAERRGELTPTAEVDRAGRDAIALMVSAFERATETEAMSLSLKYGWDERTVRIALKHFSRTGLEVFHREVLKSLDQMRRSQDQGEPVGAESTQALQ